MAINLKTEEGMEFSFDTVEELMDFKRQLDEEEDSKELTSEPIEDTSDDEIEVPGFEEINGEDVAVDENEQEFKVGDKVRVVGNDYGHWMELGELREIKEVDPNEPKYNLSGSSCGYWVGTSDIEYVHSSTKFQSGDIVKITETFEDSYGDALYGGDLHRFGKLSSGRVCISSVFVDGDNLDKLILVCRAEDRLDK